MRGEALLCQLFKVLLNGIEHGGDLTLYVIPGSVIQEVGQFGNDVNKGVNERFLFI